MQRLLILVPLFFIACAKEKSSLVNQESIFTAYSLSYDDASKEFAAGVDFHFGGSTGTYLSLDGSSAVQFDGEAMKESSNFMNQVYYRAEKNNPAMDYAFTTHSFNYTNNDGKSLYNQAGLVPMPTAKYKATSVVITEPLTVDWVTPDKIGKGTLFVNLSRTDTSKGDTVFSSGDISNSTSGTITVSSEKLRDLGAGGLNVQLCRDSFQPPSQVTQEGGTLYLKVCTTKTTVTILP